MFKTSLSIHGNSNRRSENQIKIGSALPMASRPTQSLKATLLFQTTYRFQRNVASHRALVRTEHTAIGEIPSIPPENQTRLFPSLYDLQHLHRKDRLHLQA